MAGLSAVIAAGTAYAVAQHVAPPQPVAASHTADVSAAAATAAKASVCDAIVAGERGNAGRGGVVVDGQLNMPIIVRSLNTVVAVENSLSAAVPADVAAAARRYVSTSLDLTTAALAREPVDRLTGLTTAGNEALDGVLDACGVPH